MSEPEPDGLRLSHFRLQIDPENPRCNAAAFRALDGKTAAALLGRRLPDGTYVEVWFHTGFEYRVIARGVALLSDVADLDRVFVRVHITKTDLRPCIWRTPSVYPTRESAEVNAVMRLLAK